MFGTWRLHVVGNAVDVLNPEGGNPTSGKVVSPSRMEFAPDYACEGQEQALSGVYAFTLPGNLLTFTEIANSDTCLDRVTMLTAHPWIKGI